MVLVQVQVSGFGVDDSVNKLIIAVILLLTLVFPVVLSIDKACHVTSKQIIISYFLHQLCVQTCKNRQASFARTLSIQILRLEFCVS